MMKKRLIVLFVVLSMLLPCALAGCTPEEQELVSYKTYSFTYFDTISTIIGYEASEEEFGKVSGKALDLLSEYHKLFDIYNEYDGINNLCTVNSIVDGKHPVVKVDRKIIDMLLYAKEMHTMTGGKMNVAMGSVLSIWHDYRTAGLETPKDADTPPMDKLLQAAEHTDINNIIIDEKNSTVWLADPEMKLDVGAFAKGYAVEMIARMLEDMGKTGYVVNVGGNVRTTGKKADGNKWKTGIENPTGDEDYPYVEYISLEKEAIVTSGSYQRYYSVIVEAKCSKCEWVYDRSTGIPEQGVAPGTIPSHLIPSQNKCPLCGERIKKISKNFHHIIDAETLMPSDKGMLSVSVICKDSGMGDGLSTALFCMTIEEGIAFVNSLEGVEAMWVAEDETKYYSDGFSKYIYQN